MDKKNQTYVVSKEKDNRMKRLGVTFLRQVFNFTCRFQESSNWTVKILEKIKLMINYLTTCLLIFDYFNIFTANKLVLFIPLIIMYI